MSLIIFHHLSMVVTLYTGSLWGPGTILDLEP